MRIVRKFKKWLHRIFVNHQGGVLLQCRNCSDLFWLDAEAYYSLPDKTLGDVDERDFCSDKCERSWLRDRPHVRLKRRTKN